MSTERLRRREALVVAGAVGAAALLRGTPVARLVGASTAPARAASTGCTLDPEVTEGPYTARPVDRGRWCG